ncbi:MAG: hypothetical protein HZB31_13295 [Nitrospirae bacterium]|nr:hypothetical protein [Nitrospirota bacterium]
MTLKTKKNKNAVVYGSLGLMILGWFLIGGFFALLLLLGITFERNIPNALFIGIPALGWALIPIQVSRYIKRQNYGTKKPTALANLSATLFSTAFMILACVILLTLLVLFLWYSNVLGWSPYGYIPIVVAVIALVLIPVQVVRYYRGQKVGTQIINATEQSNQGDGE